MGRSLSTQEHRGPGRRPRWHILPRLLALPALLALIALPAPSAWPQRIPSVEYQVKASYLYNFLQFVEWPPGAFADGVILVCVVGEDQFGVALREIDGETVQGSTVTVRHVRDPDELAGCQLAFVSASEQSREEQILQRLAGRPVLTVGETPGFTNRGGAINLVQVADKVKFEINQAAAEQNHLKISAQLLQLGMRR